MKKRLLHMVVVVLFLVPLLFDGKDTQAATNETAFNDSTDALSMKQKNNVNKNHDWIIRFSYKVSEKTINNENIYVLHNGEKVSGTQVVLNADKKSITIKAPKSGYLPGAEYLLFINKKVQAQNSKVLKNSVKMPFSIVQQFNTKEDRIQAFLNAYFEAVANRDFGQIYDFWDGGKYKHWRYFDEDDTDLEEIKSQISEFRQEDIANNKEEDSFKGLNLEGGFQLKEILKGNKFCESKVDTPNCLTVLIHIKAESKFNGKTLDSLDALAYAYIAEVSTDINDFGLVIEDDMDYLDE